ncbi:hypothetical protein RZS08_12965 [Arthrospira platensis SPKY1]|nr:hypothetical protein [Arthrospira platensis SPKY1]
MSPWIKRKRGLKSQRDGTRVMLADCTLCRAARKCRSYGTRWREVQPHVKRFPLPGTDVPGNEAAIPTGFFRALSRLALRLPFGSAPERSRRALKYQLRDKARTGRKRLPAYRVRKGVCG